MNARKIALSSAVLAKISISSVLRYKELLNSDEIITLVESSFMLLINEDSTCKGEVFWVDCVNVEGI
jgi:hypothetical protein